MLYNKLYSSILKSQWAFSFKHANAQLPNLVAYLTAMGKSVAINEKPEELFLNNPPKEALVSLYNKHADKVNLAEEGDIPVGTVAIVENIGTMLKYGGLCSYGTTEIVEVMRSIHNHPNVVGLIELSDSGGGAVDSIAPLVDFKQKATKPILTLADLSASANYYSAVFSDHIMASNNISAEFGSIGVMVTFNDFREHLKAEGITQHIVFADESDHKNRDFIKALDGDYGELKKFTLSPLAQKFMADVQQQRGSKLNTKAEGILAGRMFYAEQAKEDGLIDSIGTLQDAIAMVHKLAAAKNLKLSKF